MSTLEELKAAYDKSYSAACGNTCDACAAADAAWEAYYAELSKQQKKDNK